MSIIAAIGIAQLATGPQKCCKQLKKNRDAYFVKLGHDLPCFHQRCIFICACVGMGVG